MISQVESFLCPYKQDEGWSIQRSKRCVLTNNNKDEDNSPKNHNQNNIHQPSSQKFRQIILTIDMVQHEWNIIIWTKTLKYHFQIHLLTDSYIYIYIYIYVCVCVCVCVYTHTHKHIYIYIHTHTPVAGILTVFLNII